MMLLRPTLALVVAVALSSAVVRADTAALDTDRAVMLTLADAADGQRVLGTLALAEDGAFTLEFTHSIYGGWVAETYHVPDGVRLRRTGVRAERAGAAEYYALYGNLRLLDGAWTVDVPPLDLAQLTLRVDGTGRPALIARGERLELLTLVDDGRVVELRVGS